MHVPPLVCSACVPGSRSSSRAARTPWAMKTGATIHTENGLNMKIRRRTPPAPQEVGRPSKSHGWTWMHGWMDGCRACTPPYAPLHIGMGTHAHVCFHVCVCVCRLRERYEAQQRALAAIAPSLVQPTPPPPHTHTDIIIRTTSTSTASARRGCRLRCVCRCVWWHMSGVWCS